MADQEDVRVEAERLLAQGLPSQLIAATGGLHEMYLSLVGGGFTEFQALWIVGYVISGGANPKDD